MSVVAQWRKATIVGALLGLLACGEVRLQDPPPETGGQSADPVAADEEPSAGQSADPVAADEGPSAGPARNSAYDASADGTDASTTESTDVALGGTPRAGESPSQSPDTIPVEALEPCPGTIQEIFDRSAIDPPTGGSGVNDPATPERRQALQQSIRALVTGDLHGALSAAAQSGYALCRASDLNGALYAAWRPTPSGLGHAVLAVRATGASGLIVEAPHSFHDIDTAVEAVQMFIGLKARALIVSGISRCASLSPSPCDGYTTACTGIPIRYTVTDAAHNVEMLFHSAHLALSETFASDLVVSVHGFNDEGVSVSNGTRSSPELASFQVRLVDELALALPGTLVTSCQQYTGAPYERRMCGGDNVQGRHLNGSGDACANNATASSGRFIHLEQSRAVRSDFDSVIEAFEQALR